MTSAELAAIDLPQLLLALVAVVTAYTTFRLTKRSALKEAELQRAANSLGARVQAFDEMKEYADRVEAENARLLEQINRERTENDRMRQTHRQELRQIHDDTTRNKVERGRLCMEIQSHQTDIIRVLRDIVADEITHAAADSVMDEASAHARIHLQDIDDDGVMGP